MFTCPYCNQSTFGRKSLKFKLPFDDWKSVRFHASNCKKNDNSFTICEYYGPISIALINSYSSLEDFKKDYPKISFKPYHWDNLRKKNLLKDCLKQKVWLDTEILKLIKQFYKDNNRLPQARDFYGGKLPGKTTVDRHFGSWNKAIEAAGFEANYDNGYGTRTKANDNIIYRSQAEAYFVNTYLYNQHIYEYEKPYGNGWYCDFYLPEKNLYIEIDGHCRPERIKEKIEYNNKNNINCLVINTEDLYKQDFKLLI